MPQIPTGFDEIVQGTMKSSLCSDEICFADDIISVLLPTKSDFITQVISSHGSGIYPVRKDGFS